MARLSILAASVIFLAISGVSAGPCRPSSIVTSGLETTATSTEIGELTTTLTPSTTKTYVSETLTVIVLTTETATTTDAPTTFETTTALPTTTTMVMVPDPDDCPSLPNPYTAPGGTAFNIMCNTAANAFVPLSTTNTPNFEQCVLKCSEDSDCIGVYFTEESRLCDTFVYTLGRFSSDRSHVALKIRG